MSEEATVYADDTDNFPTEKLRETLNHFSNLAVSDNVLAVIYSTCHHHIDDGRECACSQFEQNTPTVIDGRNRKGNRNV